MTARASTLSRTVGQLVAERPERGRVFERLGIDYCCGGRKPLREACVQRGLDPEQVRAELEEAEGLPVACTEPDWTTAPLSDLIDHIETTHHERMRSELPRVAALVQKVAGAHGRRHPALLQLERTFSEFSVELLSHMSKEELALFPRIRELESGAAANEGRPGTLDPSVRRMMEEHDDAGRALARMRAFTSGFTPPDDACASYRVMLAGLRDLERDVRTHVHKENNILFPRAIALESCRRPTI